VSCPSINVELYPIGGFCCVSQSLLPSEETKERQAATPPADGNGFNATFGQTFHCLAAEPRETIMRVSVWDDGQLVAYETVVLGVLRSGYRNLQLRDQMGTRIELCHLLLHIDLGTEAHMHGSRQEMREVVATQQWRIEEQQRTIEAQQRQIADQQKLIEEISPSSPGCAPSRRVQQNTVL